MRTKHCKVFLLLIGMCTFCTSAIAQESRAEEFIITGKIISSDSLSPVPLAHISNKHKTRGVSADINGVFQIRLQKLDTLYFTAVGFSDGILLLDSSKTQLRNLVVLMHRKTYELKPVDIHAYDIADILNRANEKPPSMYRKDTATVKWEKPQRDESIRLSGGSIEGAVTAFANLFNDDYQERKKLKQILDAEHEERSKAMEKALLEKKFHDLAKNATNLAEPDLQHFIDYSKPDISFIRKATDYQITASIHESYKYWKFKYKIEDISLNELLDNAKFK